MYAFVQREVCDGDSYRDRTGECDSEFHVEVLHKGPG